MATDAVAIQGAERQARPYAPGWLDMAGAWIHSRPWPVWLTYLALGIVEHRHLECPELAVGRPAAITFTQTAWGIVTVGFFMLARLPQPLAGEAFDDFRPALSAGRVDEAAIPIRAHDRAAFGIARRAHNLVPGDVRLLCGRPARVTGCRAGRARARGQGRVRSDLPGDRPLDARAIGEAAAPRKPAARAWPTASTHSSHCHSTRSRGSRHERAWPLSRSSSWVSR